MLGFEFLRLNWKSGDSSQKGDSPPAYRCPLSRDDGVRESYDHALYLKIDRAVSSLPYIQRRYFVIMNRERVVLDHSTGEWVHRVLSEEEVYRRITRELHLMKTPVSADHVKNHLESSGIKSMRAAIVRAGNE